MNLDELRALITVIETGSMVSAARQLRIPRATLRRRIETLEAQVGVPLLTRSATGVRATPAGDMLASGGTALLQHGSALVARAREAGSAPAGVLRVLVPHGLPLVQQLLIVLQVARHDGLRLSIRYAADPLSELGDDVDFAVHFGTTVAEGPWLSYTLASLRERLVASRDYLTAHGEPTLEELGAHRILRYACTECPEDRLPLYTGQYIGVQPWLVAADVLALRTLARHGMGIAYVPDAGVPMPDDPTADLVPVLPDVVGRVTALRLVIPEALHDLPKVRVTRDIVQSTIDALLATGRS